MERLKSVLLWGVVALVFVLAYGPVVSVQSPTTMQVVDAISGTILNKLGIASATALRVFIVGSNSTLQTTASVSVDSVTVVNVVSTTVVGPLTTNASVSVDSATVYQGTSPWVVVWNGTNNVLAYPTGVYSVTALSALPVSGSFSVDSATVKQDLGSVPWVVTFSGTSNVLAYPTGIYSTTQVGPYTVVMNGTQNVLAYPTGVQSVTQVAPFSIVFSGTQNVLAYPTGTYPVSGTVTPSTTAMNLERVGGSAVVAARCSREEPTYVSISQTTSSQLAAGIAGERNYICSLHVVTATAQNVAVVSGTGTLCATGQASLTGFGGSTAQTGWPFAANGGVVLAGSVNPYGRTATNADAICMLQTGSGTVIGGLTYVSQ